MNPMDGAISKVQAILGYIVILGPLFWESPPTLRLYPTKCDFDLTMDIFSVQIWVIFVAFQILNILQDVKNAQEDIKL
jgi:hypothetical protein